METSFGNKFLNSRNGRLLRRDINRADRIAAKSTRRGRQTQAANKRSTLAKKVANRTTAVSVSSTGLASGAVKEAKKKEEEND